MNKLYSIQNLYYEIDNNRIIENINYDIEEGITIVNGANGAGKTTLLKLLFGIIKPTSGTINNHFDTLNQKISFIFQDPVFLNRSVEDNLKHVLKCKSIYKKNWSSIISDSIQRFSCEYLLKTNINNLSGGELQLLSLMRGTMLDPDILFYDEPTNNLDDENIKLIKSFIENFYNKGRSIIMVTHNDYLIDDMKHKKLTLKNGNSKDV